MMERSFFERDTEAVAEALIGCHLVRRTAEGVIRIRLTETEAYKGAEDPASHAFRGVTARNSVMFGPPGVIYVYLIYGLHHCINLVAHEPNRAGAVLLRAGEAVEGIGLVRANRPGVPDARLLNGPGKLAAALRIDRALNGYDPFESPDGELWLEPGEAVLPSARTPRIGISAAKELPWRFLKR